jgi:hypothetical protein
VSRAFGAQDLLQWPTQRTRLTRGPAQHGGQETTLFSIITNLLHFDSMMPPAKLMNLHMQH